MDSAQLVFLFCSLGAFAEGTKLLVMFGKHNESVSKFWLHTFGDEELTLGGRSYCTIFTNSPEHALALHELSLVGTSRESTFEDLRARTEEATRRLLPARITSPAEERPVPTVEGLQTGCLLFWVNKTDKAHFPAKCANAPHACLPCHGHHR